jgi:diguanylate cyclase (GGDEF)-like protein
MELSPNETFLYIESSLIKIDKLWESYEKHFKRENEMEYIEYVSSEMKATNDYFSKLLEAHKAENELKVVDTTSIEKEIARIDVIIQKLVNYEVGVAKFERSKFLQLYNSTLLQVGIVLLLIILAVLFISYQVFASIQKDHTELENVTKKLRGANKKLETVSYTDSLTTLHNRRYFNLVYDREIKRAKRTHSDITFMMLDIDYFKQYNDTYGHIEGDHALKSVAKVLKDTLQRAGDYIFRLGGEEFGVLLTQTDAQNSAMLAQALCNAVKDRNIKHESSKASEFLTISIGVVSCTADDALDEDILISHADKMLYKAKERGRNRYVMDSNIGESKISNDAWSVVEVSAEV